MTRLMCHCFGVFGEAVQIGETTLIIELTPRQFVNGLVYAAGLRMAWF